MKANHCFKNAFISGATSGIGKALSYKLALLGINLILTGRNKQELQKIVEKFPHHSIEIYPCDLSNILQRQKLIEFLKTKDLDLVINNAGFGIYGPTLNFHFQQQHSIVEVNSIAPFEITFELAKKCHVEKKGITIMNISSVSGEIPCPYSNVYAASKAFMTSFSRGLNAELSNENIFILTSAPGQIYTTFSKRAGSKKENFRQTEVMTVEFAVEKIWNQIISKKEYKIFNLRYLLMIKITKLIPYFIVQKFIKNRIKERIN